MVEGLKKSNCRTEVFYKFIQVPTALESWGGENVKSSSD